VKRSGEGIVSTRMDEGRGNLPRPALFARRGCSRVAHRAARRPLVALPSRLLASALCLLALICPAAQASWVKQKSGTLAWLRAVYFVDERHGWAVGGKGALLVTEDGGATWRQLPPPAEESLRDIFFADESNGWLVCERNLHPLRQDTEPRSYLLRTTDGGRSWSRVAPAASGAEGRLVGLRFADVLHGWAFGELGTLYATRDGGATWTRQSVPTRRLLLGAKFLDARRGWLVGAGGTLLRTEDGGTSWREGQLAEARAVVAPSAAPKAEFAAGPRFNAVDFADERRGWAVGSLGSIYVTEDGGRTWRAQQSGVTAELRDVKFTNAREGWAVGAQGVVLRTRDGGQTWQSEKPVTQHALERLHASGSKRLWAVGFGGTIIALRD
jgi:photosystem II stability/assembly factor-like uncharacterized protein